MSTDCLSKKSPPPGTRGYGKIQFLAQSDEIKKSLDKGWPAKEIWRHLHEQEKIYIQYPVFCRYINELIKGKKPAVKKPSTEKYCYFC